MTLTLTHTIPVVPVIASSAGSVTGIVEVSSWGASQPSLVVESESVGLGSSVVVSVSPSPSELLSSVAPPLDTGAPSTMSFESSASSTVVGSERSTSIAPSSSLLSSGVASQESGSGKPFGGETTMPMPMPTTTGLGGSQTASVSGTPSSTSLFVDAAGGVGFPVMGVMAGIMGWAAVVL